MAAIEIVLCLDVTQDHAHPHSRGEATECSNDVDGLDVPRLDGSLAPAASQPVHQRLTQGALAAPGGQAHCRDAKPPADRVGEVAWLAPLLFAARSRKVSCAISSPSATTAGQHRRQPYQL